MGELSIAEKHADCCLKQAWECQYCGLKCPYEEGEEEHWPTCSKYPEPCPNGCEVGSVERCNVEQHRSVCSLEPVCCEMREFGCSVVVPRKDLATHMRESELQHLTGMAVLNLRLTRKLQEDMAEKDKMITELQQQMAAQRQLQNDMKKEIDEQKKLEGKQQTVMRKEMAEQREMMKKDMTKMKEEIQEVQNTAPHVALLNAGLCKVLKVFTFDEYWMHKSYHTDVESAFYSHRHGYKFKLKVAFTGSGRNGITPYLYLLAGKYDDGLPWPVDVTTRLELLNQDGEHGRWAWNWSKVWMKEERYRVMSSYYIRYSDLEDYGGKNHCVSNNCLKFRLFLEVQIA